MKKINSVVSNKNNNMMYVCFVKYIILDLKFIILAPFNLTNVCLFNLNK